MVREAAARRRAREGSAREHAFTPEDERAWVEGIRRGDQAAFEAMVRAFGPALVRFAFGIVQDAAEAEDVVQEVFWKVWQAGEKWRAPASLRAYLYIAVQNQALMVVAHLRMRKKHTHRLRALHEDALQSQWPADRLEALAADGETRAHLEALRAAFQRLPKQRQLVLRLRYELGFKYRELGPALGLKEKSGEVLLERALKALREALLGGGE